MNNILLMRVTAVMPNVDLSEIDASLENLTNIANAIVDGQVKEDMKATINKLFEQRELIRSTAERDMVHVELIDDDSGPSPVGVANFLVPTGEFKEGSTYRVTTEEVA